MKVILSRKGFDSTAGGVASPIFPDGSMLSLPIPDPHSRVRYVDLRSPISGFESVGDIVERMPGSRIRKDDFVHLDPDLDEAALTREAGWKPIFGQTAAAQSHLESNGVDVGDIFVMFGWYREVVVSNGVVSFRRGAPDIHVIFGWMQIGEIIELGANPANLPTWAQYHPHNVQGVYGSSNRLYVAAEMLSLQNATSVPGAGVFRNYDERRRLTASGARLRTQWTLPRWFDPARTATPLTYHNAVERWNVGEDRVDLRTVGRGQEFVFDAKIYPEALEWIGSLFD